MVMVKTAARASNAAIGASAGFATGAVSPDTILRKIAQPLAEFTPFLETIFNLVRRGVEGRLVCCDAIRSLAAVSRDKNKNRHVI
jgi:hypothetical protein